MAARRTTPLLASLFLVLFAAHAGAVVVLPESLVAAAARATEVVSGRIVSATPRWGDASHNWIVTDYRVAVDEAIRTSAVTAGSEVTVTVWGGTIGEETWRILGVEQPVVGERYLFLLRPENPDERDGRGGTTGGAGTALRPIGLTQGVLALQADADGELVVREHDGAALQRGLTTDRPEADGGEVSLDAVRAALAATRFVSATATGAMVAAARAAADAEALPYSRPAPDGLQAHPYFWYGFWLDRVPVRPFGSWAASWVGEDVGQINKWNYYAQVFDIRASSQYFYPRDGIADLAGWLPSSVTQSSFGYTWEPGTIGVTFSYSLGLLITDATVALNPDYSWTRYDEFIYRGQTTALSFNYTMLHELGHVFGLDHQFARLSVMNYPPAAFRAVSLPYADDITGLRALYPGYAYARTDISVNMHYHGSGLGDFRDAVIPASVAAGQTLTVSYWEVQNLGTTTVAPTVEWWLMSRQDPASSAIFLRQVTLGPALPPGYQYTPSSMLTSLAIPATVPAGQYYLMAYVRGDGGPLAARFPWGNNYAFSRSPITVTGGTSTLAPPSNLAATVGGSSVTFTWTPPSPPPSAYILEAGSATGAANLAVVSLPGTLTTFTAAAPAGTFFVRLRSSSATAVSAPSNEVTFTIGGTGGGQIPGAPTGLQASASGSTVTVTWTAPASGGAPTGYILEAGSGPGQSDIANAPVGPATVFITGGVPPGTYYLRVRATNTAGTGPASNEFVLIVR